MFGVPSRLDYGASGGAGKTSTLQQHLTFLAILICPLRLSPKGYSVLLSSCPYVFPLEYSLVQGRSVPHCLEMTASPRVSLLLAQL
ncbi:hypothetical protein E2C01_009367 [Portunus trituberculatus]|uniref:Uncharacterized protein n=1 Tax=Portunus trituberculatus TaxID=210409 RepID=A0A5B7D4F6_PORTR|nr:hypothetical protein [Portunus trituberculatus]